MITALALALLAGCSGEESGEQAAVDTTPPAVRDLNTYDVFVQASAEDNPLFADLYGIRFAPFVVDRITTGKRISTMGADAKHLVVAAADGDVDRLAMVTGAGELQPIPGLDRPYGFSPDVIDGVLYYEDIDPEGVKDENRFFAFDLNNGAKKLLFRSAKEYNQLKPLSGGRLLMVADGGDGSAQVTIRSKSGDQTRYTLGGQGGAGDLGRDWFAGTLGSPDDNFGGTIEALVLLDPDTGRMKRVPDLQVLSWNPDGTRLLARRAGTGNDSRLVLLDPNKPEAAVDVLTVPGLTIYDAVWVRGDAPRAN